MKEIPLTRGRVAIVDDEDYERIAAHNWQFTHKGYAERNVAGQRGKKVRMHREILGASCDGMEVDHVNTNKIDNRKCNLRIATTRENQCNRGKPKHNSTGYKGVSLIKKTGRFRAAIMSMGRTHYLGQFKSKIEAHLAYRQAAERLHGAFARGE